MRHQPANLLGGSYRDENLLWSSQDTVNWLPTVAQQEGTRTQVKFATPPGLSYFTQCGDGPIRGARDVEGKLFVVSGSGLYEIALDGTPTLRGTIPGVGRVSMSHNKRGYGNQLLIANGDAGYVWDTTGTTLTKITDSGYPGAVMIDYLDHYLIQVEPFGRFWFHSNLDNASDYNTLDRYDAEAATDKMVGIAANQLEAVVFNGKTIEFFADTGATTGTFQSKRIVIERGCAGRHTIVKLDNTLMWLGNDGIFYRLNGYGAQPISQGPLSRAIAGLDWSRAFGFTWEDKGYKVAYWTFPDGQTWGYDPTQPPGYQWHRRESYGLDRWRLNTCTLWQGMWIGGDYRTGVLYRLDWNSFTEMGEPMVSERTGPTVSDNQNAVLCPYLELIFDTGSAGNAAQLPPAPSITGDLPDGFVGDSGTLQYVVTGGVLPYGAITVLSGSLPPGATMDSAGLVTYDYTTAGSYAWTVGGADAEGTPFMLDDTAEIGVVVAALYVAIGSNTYLAKSTDGGMTFPDTVATGVTSSSTNSVGAADGFLYHYSATTSTKYSTDATTFSSPTGLTGFSASLLAAIKTSTEWLLFTDNGVDALYASSNGIAFVGRAMTPGDCRCPVMKGTTILGISANTGGNAFTRSTNEGVTFAAYTEAAFHGTSGLQRIVLAQNGDYLAFGRNPSGNLLIGRSTTGASGTWTTAAGPTTSYCVGARVASTGRIVIVLASGAAYYSDDHGVTWNAGAAVTMGSPVSVGTVSGTADSNLYYSNDAFFVIAPQGAGVNRIYRSPDAVTAWSLVYTSPVSAAINSITEFAP